MAPIKATKDLREYKEDVYFGLSLRQLMFGGIAIALSVGLYFLLRNVMSMESLGWVCILAAVVPASFGFVRWHGMNMEALIPAIYRSAVCHSATLVYRPENPYRSLIKGEESNGKRNRREAKSSDAKVRKGSKDKAQG